MNKEKVFEILRSNFSPFLKKYVDPWDYSLGTEPLSDEEENDLFEETYNDLICIV